MGGRREAVSYCANENELVLSDCWGWRPASEMEEGATEEGEVDDWFAERSPSVSVLLVVLVVLFLLLELIVLFCERCNMSIILGEGAYGAGGNVMVDKDFVVFADDINSDIYEFRNK
jgi:hypothetical protein